MASFRGLAVVAAAWFAGAAGAHAATLTIACGSNAADREFCARYAQDWGRRNGHEVRIYSAPASATDNLALLRQQFAAKSDKLDVLTIDVVWPGVLKDHLVDLKPYSQGAERQHFPAIVANNTIGGRLLGMPWYTDAGLLFYRQDLLEKYGLALPRTWHEMAQAARRIQDGERAAGARDFHGYVFQGRAYEGLSCNALEWVASYGGGTIVDASGKVTIHNAQAARALDEAASWVGTIAPRGVLNYGEEEARGVWQNGQAAFMRNWPYAWAMSQAEDSVIRGKVGVAPLPAGDGEGARPAATLGGWQLAVSRYSRHVEAAAALVMYLTSAEIQKQRAIGGAYNPTIPALYRDPELLAANPFMGDLLDVFENAVARPATPTGLKYPAVSRAFWDATHEVLSGRVDGAAAVRRLEGRLLQTRRAKW
ncbi:ABC transporter substrate-binding protein [Rubrivivax gelatinosus]|uniref:Carbohydrate ABC transporter substrate-binding protein (CUT1 family) n=1 Tax=Rubrivivax gelatinosus TaxID=28068 RepID=A0A4R2MG90_RUBGE|nr:ABC transporter substrate-binding protein [Rubrivivax gelatinosus]MBK1687906.1 ABC transporter substrate-binding protein [Rubrivivax gelatinosus]TCP01756.1 carbohydrate ABC transporter substrate-binding protein (CUT1 family) [Rubrivivax gelatinosus]